jgi:hypothetical protein
MIVVWNWSHQCWMEPVRKRRGYGNEPGVLYLCKCCWYLTVFLQAREKYMKNTIALMKKKQKLFHYELHVQAENEVRDEIMVSLLIL